MLVFTHFISFILSALSIWFFAGLLIGSVDRVARKLHRTGFIVAFFVLGLLTSISEFSVAFNSTLNKVPQVSAGNLAGASLVIFLLIIPFLAFVGRGVRLQHTLSYGNLFIALAVILLPAFFVFDGEVTSLEGAISVLAYLVLLLFMFFQKSSTRVIRSPMRSGTNEASTSLAYDGVKILLGGIAIFVAAHFLVEQAVFFADFFSVPNSLIGLIILSIGTNVPELVIAVRSIVQKHKDIAFGDYIGSAATNTLIFGLLSLVNGGFILERSEFVATSLLLIIGLVTFFVFANSKKIISRKEGLVLILFYCCFLAIQIFNFVRFSHD